MMNTATEYEVEILQPVKFKIRLHPVSEPIPPPEPEPEPEPQPEPIPEPSPPVVLPATITVGPGKDFEDLLDLPLIPKDSTVVLYGRETPYRSKVGLLNNNITFRGENRPVLSGKGCQIPQSLSGVHAGHLTSSIVFTDTSQGIKIQDIDFEDVWEEHETILLNGATQLYPGGSAGIRALGGDVSIENCHFRRLLHAVFSKPAKADMDLLSLKNCTITQCGDNDGRADEAIYPHGFDVVMENVTIKDNRNPGTTCIHTRCDRLTLINCRLESDAGVLVFTDSRDLGKTPNGIAKIEGGTFISRGASPFFSLHSDIGPDIAIRRMEVSDALLIGVGSSRWKRTIGTPFLEGNAIRYENCTFVEMPPTNQDKGTTAIELMDDYSKGLIEIGLGNKAYIFRRGGGLYGSPGKITPTNWRDLIEIHNQQSYEQVSAFLPTS